LRRPQRAHPAATVADFLTAVLTHPDEINWGDVGTLNHYASLLRQITDSAFKEGEHAV
jgi:hypothetical protein